MNVQIHAILLVFSLTSDNCDRSTSFPLCSLFFVSLVEFDSLLPFTLPAHLPRPSTVLSIPPKTSVRPTEFSEENVIHFTELKNFVYFIDFVIFSYLLAGIELRPFLGIRIKVFRSFLQLFGVSDNRLNHQACWFLFLTFRLPSSSIDFQK